MSTPIDDIKDIRSSPRSPTFTSPAAGALYGTTSVGTEFDDLQRLGLFRQQVRSELNSRNVLDDDTRRPFFPGSTNKSSTAQQHTPVEVSLTYRQVKDPAAEVNMLKFELNLACEKYSTLAMNKEAADRRIAELQSEVESSFIRHNSVIHKLESEIHVQQNEYEMRLTKLTAENAQIRNEHEAGRKAYDAHLASCRTSTAAFEKRIAELELQLKTSETEHSSHLSNSAMITAQSTKRIADLEGQQKKTADELSALMTRFMELSAAKVKTDASNAELQDQKQKDATIIIDREARVKDTLGEVERLNKLLADAMASKSDALRALADAQSQTKKDTDELLALRKKQADLADMAVVDRYMTSSNSCISPLSPSLTPSHHRTLTLYPLSHLLYSLSTLYPLSALPLHRNTKTKSVLCDDNSPRLPPVTVHSPTPPPRPKQWLTLHFKT